MIRKNAMSTMGYAIILVIILGVVMILSAPMMMSKYKGDKKSSDEYSKKDEDYDNYKDRERDKEEYSDSRYNSDMSVSYTHLKFICGTMKEIKNKIERLV